MFANLRDSRISCKSARACVFFANLRDVRIPCTSARDLLLQICKIFFRVNQRGFFCFANLRGSWNRVNVWCCLRGLDLPLQPCALLCAGGCSCLFFHHPVFRPPLNLSAFSCDVCHSCENNTYGFPAFVVHACSENK